MRDSVNCHDGNLGVPGAMTWNITALIPILNTIGPRPPGTRIAKRTTRHALYCVVAEHLQPTLHLRGSSPSPHPLSHLPKIPSPTFRGQTKLALDAFCQTFVAFSAGNGLFTTSGPENTCSVVICTEVRWGATHWGPPLRRLRCASGVPLVRYPRVRFPTTPCALRRVDNFLLITQTSAPPPPPHPFETPHPLRSPPPPGGDRHLAQKAKETPGVEEKFSLGYTGTGVGRDRHLVTAHPPPPHGAGTGLTLGGGITRGAGGVHQKVPNGTPTEPSWRSTRGPTVPPFVSCPDGATRPAFHRPWQRGLGPGDAGAPPR